MHTVRPVSNHLCQLGEGPLWDPLQEVLYWIDSLVPRLFEFDYRSGHTKVFELPGETVGSLCVRAEGGLILAMDQGFYTFDTQSNVCEIISEPLAGRKGLRFNDGKVDRTGGFLAGAMPIDHHNNENCPLYRLAPNGTICELLDGFMCVNGPCFSNDGSQLFITGRTSGVIETASYCNGKILGPLKTLIAGLNPDGATVDSEGYIWSAQWDTSCVLRISQDGEICDRIELAGHIVSSVMFGGPLLDILFVTTVGSRVWGSVATAKDAGATFMISQTGYRGLPEPMFQG